jgi:LPXTG-motif cell wall-anchored protein
VKNIYAALVFLAVATAAFAGTVTTPEIDGSTAAGAITLISGAAFVLRSRRKR